MYADHIFDFKVNLNFWAPGWETAWRARRVPGIRQARPGPFIFRRLGPGLTTPARREAVANLPPLSLPGRPFIRRNSMDRYEYAVAAHEASHVLTAHALGMITTQVIICDRDTVLQRETGTARGLMQCYDAPGLDGPDAARAWVAVYFAGAIGGALAMRLPYDWLEYPQAALLAARHRAGRTRPADAAPVRPDPDTPAPSPWNTPSGSGSFSAWLHGGRGSDVSAALELIDQIVEGIDDPAERELARYNEVARAQRTALNILRERLNDLENLAGEICQRKGRMDRADFDRFFDRREAVRKMNADCEIIIG